MNWRDTGDLSYENWTKELKRVNSPILTEGRDAYNAAKPFSRLALAMMWHESQHQTVFNLNLPSRKNPFNLRPRGLGSFAQFDSYTDCIAEWKARITDPNYAYKGTKTLADLVAIFAPSDDNNNEAEYVSVLETMINRFPEVTTVPNSPSSTPKKILLNMGHRDTTGGGTEGGGLTERGYTDDIVLACKTALRAAGFTVYVNQELDGDTDATYLNKNLDWVGRNAVAINDQFGPIDSYLSIHLEGSGAPGVFAIVPDGNGLISFTTGQPDPGDTWSDNPLDVKLARLLAQNVSKTTGLGLRNTTEPGVMSERSTGVAEGGWRLSEFHETYPIRDHATRNILECGAMPNAHDIAIIRRPEFPGLVAAGVVAAFIGLYGVQTTEPTPVPTPKPTMLLTHEELAELFGPDYNPRGGLSKVWREWGFKNGLYPAYVRSIKRPEHGATDFLFANGLIIRRTTKGTKVLKT
jgi:N-acetylmuramoyl-L-alanine amidase